MTNLPLITDLFSLEDLQAEIDAGYVKIRQHPTAPFSIANYTAAAQYAHHWSNVTTKTRGLIYNSETLEIIARPWSKFWNVDQAETPTPPKGAAMIRSEKMDGSLGVLYRLTDGTLGIATRGSFMSDQAIHATHWLSEHLSAEADRGVVLDQLWDPTRTFLFEIVFPENRIVVNYGDLDALVLLDVIDNETGLSDLTAFDELEWPLKADKVLVPGGFYDTIFSDIPEGNEGFVLYWPHTGVRAKVKAARYIELHKLVFGLSEKSVWQQVADGKSVDEIKDGLPDELYEFVDKTYDKLRTKQLARMEEIQVAWEEVSAGDKDGIPVMLTRKEFALRAVKYKDLSKFLFKVLDGAPTETIAEMVWQELKPVGETHAKSQSEDVA
jgi:RNA ligase